MTVGIPGEEGRWRSVLSVGISSSFLLVLSSSDRLLCVGTMCAAQLGWFVRKTNWRTIVLSPKVTRNGLVTAGLVLLFNM